MIEMHCFRARFAFCFGNSY